MAPALWRVLCFVVSWMKSGSQNLLLGLVWAQAYQLVALAHPGAFTGALTRRKGWVVSVDRSDGDLPFSTRQLALEFARAYARLRRASAVQVVNEKGILEHEETVRPPCRAA
jgi:hypothetical protein